MKAIRKSDGMVIDVDVYDEQVSWVSQVKTTYVDIDHTELYQESDLDFLPEKETAVQEGWIARDRLNNALFLHDEKPWRAFSGYQTDGKEDEWRSDTCPPYPIDSVAFPSVTWQSEPKKVRIKIEEI